MAPPANCILLFDVMLQPRNRSPFAVHCAARDRSRKAERDWHYALRFWNPLLNKLIKDENPGVAQYSEIRLSTVATYFGDSRYDGRYWHNFLTKDSGLPSNFTNAIKGVDANRAWFCTDIRRDR